MSNKKDCATLAEALPYGVTLAHCFRADRRLRWQLFRIFFLGLIFALFSRGPRAYAVGLTGDALVILPLPRRQGDPGATILRAPELLRLSVKQGAMRTKISVETPSARYQLRVPGVVARGEAREALAALARFCETVGQPA